MATSGSFKVNLSAGGYLRIEWKQTKYTTSYYSKVSFTVYHSTDTAVSLNTVGTVFVACGTATASGSEASGSVSTQISPGTTRTICSGTSSNITHVAGTEHECVFTIRSPLVGTTKTKTVTLDPILDPGSGGGGGGTTSGKATITSFPSFSDESSVTVSYMNPVYGSISNLRLALTWGTYTTTARDLPTNQPTGTYSFSLDSDEVAKLRAYAYNANSFKVQATLITVYSSGESFTSSTSTTCHIIEAPPNISVTLYDTFEDSINITQNQNVIILGVNKVYYKITATGQKSAEIKSYTAINGGTKYTTSTGTFTNTIDPTFSFTVTDSRGLQSTKQVTMTYVNYKNLSCNIEVDRSNYTEGTHSVPFKITGQFFNDYIGNTRNSLSVTYRYKYSSSDNFTTWYTLTPSKSGNTYSANVSVNVTYPDSVYLEVGVGDVLDYITAGTSSSVTPIFEWGATDFKFNVPVSINDAVVPAITDKGTSGIWSYRKWYDGTAECWGTKTVDATISNATAGWYSSGELSATNLNFPFAFAERPSVIVSVMPTGNTWATIFPSNTAGSTTKTGSYQLMSTSNFTSKSYLISYHVRGRWL